MAVRLTDRLGVRVVALLSIALLPIGLISLYQTSSVVEKADALARAAYLGQTVTATERQSDLIHEGFASARVLGGALMEMQSAPGACTSLMEGFIRSHPAFALALYVEPDGVSRCNSSDMPVDLRSTETFLDMDADPRPLINATDRGRVSGQEVMVIAQPIYESGTYQGFVALSLPRANARFQPDFTGPNEPDDLITINVRGEVLLSMKDIDTAAERLPAFRDLNSQLYRHFNPFRAQDQNGVQRVYSIAPIVPGIVVAISVWPAEATAGESGLISRSAMVFPILMWIVSLVVAYFAVHRLVIRHIRSLRIKMRRFAASYSYQEPGILVAGHAPSELIQIEETFDTMVGRITRDTAELENNLHEKNVLLKEVHHRVKNNLQLIASIINMEVRKAGTDETKSTLRRIQDRVLGLATVHSNLYHTARLANLRADGLLEDILDQVLKSALPQDSDADVAIDVEEVILSPERAVPLSLLATETVTNAIKYFGTSQGAETPWIKIALVKTGPEGCRFSVSNSKGQSGLEDDAATSSGLGQQLITAFAAQLGTKATVTEDDDSYTLSVDIALGSAS